MKELPLPIWAIAGISAVMLVAVISTGVIVLFHLLKAGLYHTAEKPIKDDYFI